jgi:hypothetical protein
MGLNKRIVFKKISLLRYRGSLFYSVRLACCLLRQHWLSSRETGHCEHGTKKENNICLTQTYRLEDALKSFPSSQQAFIAAPEHDLVHTLQLCWRSPGYFLLNIFFKFV